MIVAVAAQSVEVNGRSERYLLRAESWCLVNPFQGDRPGGEIIRQNSSVVDSD